MDSLSHSCNHTSPYMPIFFLFSIVINLYMFNKNHICITYVYYKIFPRFNCFDLFLFLDLSPLNIKDDPSIFCVSPPPDSLMIPEPDAAKSQNLHSANGDPTASGEFSRTPKSVVEFVVQMEKICVRKERKATAVLGVILLLFFICWLPFFIIYICESYAPDIYRDKRPIKLYATIVWLGYVNSMLNPLVYSYMNANFRRSFAKTLGFKTSYNAGPAL